MTIQDMIGKEVHLYPGDSYKKDAILLSHDKDSGYMFEITKAESGATEKVGEIKFISNSNKVIFTLKDK